MFNLFMTANYNFDSFEISLIKQEDCVIIRCFDNTLFKVYQKNYTDVEISEISSVDIENFYKICKTSFEVLEKYGSNVNNENATIIFLSNQKHISIEIYYKLYLKFNFCLKIPLIENAIS
jgi:hypothetical protein